MPTLKMPARTYPSVDGRCVFCMNVFPPEQLTNEHIIPEAIHGALVLEKGACRPCARFSNSAYENEALNNDLKHHRLLLELRGKRGLVKRDLRHLPAVYRGNMVDGPSPGDRLTDFPVEHFPKTLYLLRFSPAGLLSGVDRGGALESLGVSVIRVPGKGLTNVTVDHHFTNGPFARMLAKIAYCYAVAEKGYTSFDGDPLRDLLCGKRDDIYNFVGSVSQPEMLTNRHLHGLYFRQRGQWLTVLVHLFASLSRTPKPACPYEVVVGELR